MSKYDEIRLNNKMTDLIKRFFRYSPKPKSKDKDKDVLIDPNYAIEYNGDYDYIIIYVLGLGCHKNSILTNKMILDWISYHNRDTHTRLECNHSYASALKNVAKTVCYIPPSKSDNYVIKLQKIVEGYLYLNKKVMLLGHSYGGSVVARIAEYFNNKSGVKNLHVATFGSIYISNPKDIKNVDMMQYMKINDVALKCNKLTSPKFLNYKVDVSNKLTWINAEGKQWDIHNSYDEVIRNVFMSKDVNSGV